MIDFAASSVKRSTDEAPAAPVAVALNDMGDLSQYANTVVRIDPVEFVTPYGGYAPFFEKDGNNEETTETEWVKNVKAGYRALFPYHTLAPQLVRDTKGNVVKLYFLRSFTEMYARNLPAGSGALTALVTKFRGEYILQIRNTADDALSADSETRFSTTLMQGWAVARPGTSVPVFGSRNTAATKVRRLLDLRRHQQFRRFPKQFGGHRLLLAHDRRTPPVRHSVRRRARALLQPQRQTLVERDDAPFAGIEQRRGGRSIHHPHQYAAQRDGSALPLSHEHQFEGRSGQDEGPVERLGRERP